MIEQNRLDKGLYWQRAWKLTEGCTKVSPGCDNCWSEQETVMRSGHPNEKISSRAQAVVEDQSGNVVGFDGRVIMREDNLEPPLRTRKPTVFAIWNDLYHAAVTDDFRDRAYAVMALCPQHVFLVLTKQAKRMAEYWLLPGSSDRRMNARNKLAGYPNEPVPDSGNYFHGVTAEDQQRADERIPHLLMVPGRRFLSLEPMLGPVDLSSYLLDSDGWYCQECDREVAPAAVTYRETHDARCEGGCGQPVGPFPPNIHACLLGGESGKNARPMHPDWARSVRDQCAAAAIPFYFKQWGEFLFYSANRGNRTEEFHRLNKLFSKAIGKGKQWPVKIDSMTTESVYRIGKKKAGRLLDGQLHDDLAWRD